MSLGRDFFDKDAHAQSLGIRLIGEKEGWAKTQLTIKEQHLNSLNTAHGAVIFAVADTALAVAANNNAEAMGIGLQVTTSYLSMGKLGDVLTAETKAIAVKNRIGNYTADVTNQDGELIATLQGMVYRKKRA